MSGNPSEAVDRLANVSDADLIEALRSRRGVVVVTLDPSDLRHLVVNGNVAGAEDLTEEQIDDVVCAAFDSILETNFEEQATDRILELMQDGYDPVGRMETAIAEIRRAEPSAPDAAVSPQG